MWIFTGVPRGRASNDSGVVDDGNFQRFHFSVAISSEALDVQMFTP